MQSGKPSEWSRDERDRPVTSEELWYELDALRRNVDTKLLLLGRKGARAARFPEQGWQRDPFRSMNIALDVLIAVLWTVFVAMIAILTTR